MKKLLFFIFVLTLYIVCSVPAKAQITTSSINGVVLDPSGPLISATVLAIHEPSGTRYGTMTNIQGRYNLPNMQVGGPYKIEVSYIGYKTQTFSPIFLNLGDNYTQNATLNENALLEEIVVVAHRNNNMSSERAGSSTKINRVGIEMAPSVSRSMNDIMRMSPQSSVSTQGLSVGGGNYRQSYVTVDGASFNNSFGIGQSMPSNGSPISLDALEQITVSVTPFDVRQSGFTGGAINAVTRSGNNQLIATAYTYMNSQQLKGIQVGEHKLNRSKGQYHTYGASVGGPIIKNKLFFFVNGEYEANITAGPDSRPRDNENASWGSNNISRPTIADMETMSKYMADKYGYQAGAYMGYDIKLPAYRITARINWNISDNHKMNIRFTKAHTKESYSPHPSTFMFDPSKIYPGHSYNGDRASKYALTYENSRFFQVRNFTSFAAELNSKLLSGKLNNTLRLAYSLQDEPRQSNAGYFPSVDILKDGDVYTALGPDPFTYGTLVRVQTFIATDEISYTTGIHSMLGGIQLESNYTENGFIPAGTGYYVFSSWDDFVQGKKPAAFSVSHPNKDNLKNEINTFRSQQVSLFYQDEMSFSEKFKLTVGLRLEMPLYPALKDNYNAEFSQLKFDGKQYSTDQLPKTTVNFSPRVGFNWDITGERKYVLRGGAGLFTGRMPFIWLISAVGYSNVQQYSMCTYNPAEMPNFHANPEDLFKELYNGQYKKKELSAPQTPTILSEDLKMPSTLKTSLAFDAKLLGDIDFTLQGIYSHNINPIKITKLGMNAPSEIKLSTNDTRPLYNNGYYALNSEGRAVTPFVIGNGGGSTYYYSISAQLNKRFDFGLNASFAYAYSHATSYGDGIDDMVTDVWGTPNIGGSNDLGIGYSGHVSPHRFVISADYKKEYGKHFASSISLIYIGSQSGYQGVNSFSRYSYTYSNNPLGDGGPAPLMYVPVSKDELPFSDIIDKQTGNISYSKEDQANDFWAYINNDKYLSKHKGMYAERNGGIMPWNHQVDLRFMQDFFIKTKDSRNTIQFGVDIKNVGNLLNKNWGAYKQVNINANTPLHVNVSPTGDVTYNMNTNGDKKLVNTFTNYQGFASTFSVQFSVRYIFN